MEEIVRKPITAELKALEVGECVRFPIEQRSSVISVVSRLKKEMMRYNWDFRFTENANDFTISVVRIR